jgi:hypothetical protein
MSDGKRAARNHDALAPDTYPVRSANSVGEAQKRRTILSLRRQDMCQNWTNKSEKCHQILSQTHKLL